MDLIKVIIGKVERNVEREVDTQDLLDCVKLAKKA